MTAWFHFWTFCFVISAGAFAFITAVVLVRGIRDLRTMFFELRQRQRDLPEHE